MLNTLVSLGKEIAKQQGEWDSLIEIPKFNDKSKTGESISNYVLVITFDIDEKTIKIGNDLRAFSVKTSPTKYRNIRSELWGRRGDPWMVTCSYPKHLPILQKSIFGKPDEDKGQGLFQKSIMKLYPEVKETIFYKALEECYSLRNVIIEENITAVKVFDSDYISKKLSLPKNNKVVLLSLSIKSEILGIAEPTLLCNLDGFDFYVKKRFLREKDKSSKIPESLCYVTGQKSKNVVLPSFSDREDLNKLFVITTINYANNFNKKKFNRNYQIDSDTNNALQNGSNYIRGILNNQRCSVRIANVEHYIIPSFINPEDADIKFELDRIKKMSDWIFSTKQLNNTFKSFEIESENSLFWINYIAYLSDGNSVKVINQIKDISNVWLHNIIKCDIFQSSVISNYFKHNILNLSTIYFSIPVRKDHEQKNDALKLLSQILEQREIKKEKLFDHFIELILCHYYNRYRSYSNITFQPNSFDFAIQDSVIKYLFLFNLLKSLKLTNMEETEKTSQTVNSSDKLQKFFTDMGYTPQQQTLYWLGQLISKIGTAQFKKGHSQKPVLNKIPTNVKFKTHIIRCL